MPFTFSHPLAVVPLRRLCPARLNFAALVIGSMAPDFGYYVNQFPASGVAHTIPGTFIICLPTGLLALAAFYLLRRPLCFMLPQPHRGALMPLAMARPHFSPLALLSAAASVWLGAGTHILWDSFTHEPAWVVQHVPILNATVFHFGGTEFRVCYLLQHLSTFGGGAALVLLYVLWLRQQRPAVPTLGAGSVPEPLRGRGPSDGWRYALLGTLGAVALGAAGLAAAQEAALAHGFKAVQVFLFRTCVYSAAAFAPMLTVCSVILYSVGRARVRTD